MRSWMLFALLAIVPCWADGLPFNADRTHLGVKYTTLKLTHAQQVEVERTRSMTLTKEQWIRLLKIGKACPKRLEILPSYYDDCTCGTTSIAVWFKPGEVEVPHSFIPIGDEPPEMIEEFDASHFGLVIDPVGDYWFKGKVLPLEAAAKRALAITRKLNEDRAEGPNAVVFTPPQTCIRDRRRYLDQLKRLKVIVERLGGKLYAPGFSNPDAGN